MSHCGYCETRLRALVDGELEPAEAREVLAHLERCLVCSRAYSALQGTVALLQDQPLEDAPPHFTASLQVRLSAHRRKPARRPRAWEALRRFLPVPSLSRPALPTMRSLRWAGGLTTALVLSLTCMFVTTSRSIGATEVARRAEQSWLQVRNYGCVFVSTGVYQGQPRSFTQRQFFRRPGDFRLETAQDYPLTTFVRDDRLIHYIPGGQWDGQGPLVIVRPRSAAVGALPFPFGATWQNGGNVSLDQLIRQLREQHDTHLVGTERIGDRECYRLAFTESASGDRYELWVDRETFIPRRVSWYRDEQNHIVTEAQELQVNYDLLPRDTFDFRIPDGAFVVHGDVDPHVLALPFRPARTAAYDREPVETAQLEAWQRSGRVPFPVLTPEWLPDGYRLVRVRSKSGRWVDAHWLREGENGGKAQVLKLVQHDGRLDLPESWRDGEIVKLGTGPEAVGGFLLRRDRPYPYRVLTWGQGPTRLTLFAAGLDSATIIRIAESLRVATAPLPRIGIASGHLGDLELGGEPSMLPFDSEAVLDSELGNEGLFLFREQMPMLPEQPDDDLAVERTPIFIR